MYLEQNPCLWQNENICITPHIASITDPNSVKEQILLNYNNILQNKELINTINRQKDY